LEELGLDGRIIVTGTFGKRDVEAWTGLIRLRTGTGAGLV
jgi:hypothetical protein